MTSQPLGSDGPKGRAVVCVQGLGFVGAAMALAIADARDGAGHPIYDVVGVDLPTEDGLEKVDSLNRGILPFRSSDAKLTEALARAHAAGNLKATVDPAVYAEASVIVVDVHFDVDDVRGTPSMSFDAFTKAIETIGVRMRQDCLVVVETTVPPGTCERVVAPLLETALETRGLNPDGLMLAHSYERVMPGSNYFDSIVNFWRVYSGHTEESATACERFLSTVINVNDFPLTRLASTTASETAKVLENSYRAVNIAFMEEWGRYAEQVGIDLFPVIAAIRQRPTHSNMRQPGFGVGGYCLTKDPLLAGLAASEIFGLPELEFPFSTAAVRLNNDMPLVSVRRLESALGGSLEGRRILLLGVSYREDVGDTRHSPSEIFVRHAESRGASVTSHDPLVSDWPELGRDLPAAIPSPAGFDAVVFAVPHAEYRSLDVSSWLGSARPTILDSNCVLSMNQRDSLRRQGCRLLSIGRGDAQ